MLSIEMIEAYHVAFKLRHFGAISICAKTIVFANCSALPIRFPTCAYLKLMPVSEGRITIIIVVKNTVFDYLAVSLNLKCKR